MTLFFHILGMIVPIDFHIFQRGSNHQPDDVQSGLLALSQPVQAEVWGTAQMASAVSTAFFFAGRFACWGSSTTHCRILRSL